MKKAVTLKVDGLTISGQLYLPEGKGNPFPAVCLCHGVPSGIVDPTDGGYPLLAEKISKEGFAALTFSFRGTGISCGNFDIQGWTKDLKAAIDYLCGAPEIDKNHICLLGFSAGASISVYVGANDKRVAAIAACACPSDFSAISENDKAQQSISYFRKIGIIRNNNFPPSVEKWLDDFRKVNAAQMVAKIAPRPLLLVHAKGDKVVPVSHSQRLFELAGEPKQLFILDGDEHRLRRNDEAMDIVFRWLKSHL